MSALCLAGALSACVAAAHAATLVLGAPAYRYLGAGERMARLAERGAPGPPIITVALTLMFAAWAAYAFSGAGLLRPLPLLRPVLLATGAAYTLRGVIVAPQLVWFVTGPRPIAGRHLVFSAISLVIGLLYLAGTLSVTRSGTSHSPP
jgi:hypothetical protein